MTTFSVVFVYKFLYNAAGKNSVKIKEKKTRLKTKEKQAQQNDKIKKKTFVAVFAEWEFD